MKMKYPLAKYSEEPVTDYPLTKDELRALAMFWSEEYLDTCIWCCFSAQIGSTEIGIKYYANDRLTRIEAILGEEEIKTVDAEVEEIMRERLGEKGWKDFLEGKPAKWVRVSAKELARLEQRKKRIENAKESHRSRNAEKDTTLPKDD